MDRYDLIVLGGGSGGLVAGVGAAQLGARVLLIEKKALGGDCLFTGCVPSKTFIRSARFAAEVRRAGDFGFAPIGDLQFKGSDFAAITDRVGRVIKTVGEHDAPEVFRNQGVEILFGSPRFISPHEMEVEAADNPKQRVRARRFCISTGSRPATPPVEGLEETGFITNEEVFHTKKLPASLIVLGGGPVGVELGQSFARLGSEVTIVQRGARLLPKDDEEAATELTRCLRDEGINVLLKTEAVCAAQANGHKTITVKENGATRELHAEEILVAAGRRPNTEGLNLEAAGVKYDKQKIVTDEYLRTTAKHIYAAGDVTGHYLFTHMAAYEAALVVRNALFFYPLTQKADFRVVPWATYTDPEVARVGMTEKEAREKYGDGNVRVYRSPFADNDRAHAEEETRGFAKLVCAGRKEEIVGCTIVGAHAGELIHEVVLAMKHRLSASALGGLTHVYPTLTQVTQKAGLDAILASLARYRPVLSRYFAWRR
ncbi:MAG: FAD-dependent oxidoreductase [Pyrinomonadaceae bacterium]|nr:FAD-dependent oxidoreductase [Pyrinomonadaceae bacterium]